MEKGIFLAAQHFGVRRNVASSRCFDALRQI
jgi:hypothetical protein